MLKLDWGRQAGNPLNGETLKQASSQKSVDAILGEHMKMCLLPAYCIFGFYRTQVRSLATLVSNSLTQF